MKNKLITVDDMPSHDYGASLYNKKEQSFTSALSSAYSDGYIKALVDLKEILEDELIKNPLLDAQNGWNTSHNFIIKRIDERIKEHGINRR